MIINLFKTATYNLIQVALVGLLLGALNACAPRGETNTIDEILESSQSRYQTALKQDVNPALKGDLALVTSYLDNVLTAEDLKLSSEELSKKLYALTSHAGFTSRPAMNELARQYTELAVSGGTDGGEGRRKLLVSRTYTILAQELETMKFRL